VTVTTSEVRLKQATINIPTNLIAPGSEWMFLVLGPQYSIKHILEMCIQLTHSLAKTSNAQQSCVLPVSHQSSPHHGKEILV
jgi:hypothetical protein